MKIIIKKEVEWFALFLVVSGLGAWWLTFCWSRMGGNDYYLPFLPTLCYYLFNSILLFLLGILLYAKYFKIYSILAIILGISVTMSLFVFHYSQFNIFQNLFFATTVGGMIGGIQFGGTVLVPMFLVGVYMSAFRGVQYIRGKIDYNLSEMDK